MELSIFLAKVIGPYLMLLTASSWLNKKQMESIVADFLASKPLWLFSSAFMVILGLLLTVSHNVWVLDWRVIVTLLGWMILICGSVRLFFPEQAKSLVYKVSQSSLQQFVLLFFFAIGVILAYQGFFG